MAKAINSAHSYRELDPIEQGGRTARDGFAYQDSIAVNKCFDMLLDQGPCEVWCEAEDDLVLVWAEGEKEVFEFVQVKGTDLQQAWTVAKLCEVQAAKGKGKGYSILAKSLSHDRGSEKCRFRLITKWPPDATLNVLVHALSDRNEGAIKKRLATATKGIQAQTVTPKSPNGNNVPFWVKSTTWEHRATTQDVLNDSLVKLSKVLEKSGRSLAPDQCLELHTSLFQRVQECSMANGITEKSKKRLTRTELRDWLLERARVIQHPGHSGGAGPLQQKLLNAGIGSTALETAKELRRRYLAEARVPKYLTLEDRDHFEGEVLTLLHRLKSQLDAGQITEDGKLFLARCLSELDELRNGFQGPKPPNSIFVGYMYEVMNRCLHRLERLTT